MNERIKQLALQAGFNLPNNLVEGQNGPGVVTEKDKLAEFAELIVREMCGLMEQVEDDAYHCFEPSERPTEYIEWLRDWQERFTKHFGVEE
jgi:hypothetical protein